MPLFCKHPDRDVPALECGHPLPCPYHTIVIDQSGRVEIPGVPSKEVLSKVIEVAKVIKKVNET